MTSDDNPLAPLAEIDVPDLDPVRRDRLEAALRVRFAEHRNVAPRRPVPRGLVVGPALALVLLIATIAFLVRGETAVAALEIRDAENVVVMLPDGEVVTDPADGFALVDGAVVVVGEGGTVTIDEVTLPAGTRVVVRSGRLVSETTATTTTDRPATALDETSDDRPAGARPSEVPEATTTTTAPARPTPSSTTTTEPAPPSTRPSAPPVESRAPSDPAPGVIAPDPPGDSPPGVELAVSLRVSVRDGAVRVGWSVDGSLDPGWRVVVVRTADGSEPVDLAGAVVVAEGARGESAEPFGDLPERIETLRYRVLVLDEGDGVVARSAVQTIAAPGS
ncbi:MAG: hypothetical protein R2707_00880 [Acidimicrobiales bacterium]